MVAMYALGPEMYLYNYDSPEQCSFLHIIT